MKTETQITRGNKLILIGCILFVLVIMFLFSWVTSEGNYINRPFSECEQNFTRDYGTFQSCGDLMSDDTAKSGLMFIFIGLPVFSFIILPLLVKIKKGNGK